MKTVNIYRLMYVLVQEGQINISVNGKPIQYNATVDNYYIRDGKHIIWIDPETIVTNMNLDLSLDERYIDKLNASMNPEWQVKEYMD